MTLFGDYYAEFHKQRAAGWYAFALHQAQNPKLAYEVALEAEAIATDSTDEIVGGALPLAAYWAACGEYERARLYLERLCRHNVLYAAISLDHLVPGLFDAPICAAVIENCAVN